MGNPYQKLLVVISTAILLFIAATSAKSTGGCSVMVPMMGTIWKTSEMVTVRWSGFKDEKIPSIMLARTNEEGTLVDIGKIASDVPGAIGKHTLKLPSNVPTADKYVVILKDGDDVKCTSNSFFIEQGSPVAPDVDIVNPPPNAELPSQGTGPVKTEKPGAPSSSLAPHRVGSITNTSKSKSGSGPTSHSAHEAVRTGSATRKPSSNAAKENNMVSSTLGSLLTLIILLQVLA